MKKLIPGARNRRIIIAIACACFLITAATALIASRALENQDRYTFDNDSVRIQNSSMDQLRSVDISLHNIAALFSASAPQVDSDWFRLIAEATVARMRSVESISFSKLVQDNEKASFENQIRQSGGTLDFRIHWRQQEIQKSEFYLPVTFIEPLTPQSIHDLGFDVFSKPELRDNIRYAIISGATVPILTKLHNEQDGFSLIKAVYQGKIAPKTIEQRKKTVIGILRVDLSTKAFISNLGLDGHHVRLSFYPNHFESDTPTALIQTGERFPSPFLPMAKFFNGYLSGTEYVLEVNKDIPFAGAKVMILVMIFISGFALTALVVNRVFIFLRSQEEFLSRHNEIEKKVEEKTRALQNSEVILRRVINANPNIIFAKNREGRILFANRACIDLFGLNQENLIGCFPDSQLPGERGRISSPYEEQIKLTSGERLWFETVSVPIRLENDPDCFLVVAVDITQRKANENLIFEQQAKIISSSKLSSLGEMAAGIAHEINSPLAIIKLVMNQTQNLLKLENPSMERVKQNILLVEKTADRIAKIITGLRTFSRDGSNDPFNKFQIGRMIEDTLSFCRERYKNNGIDLRVDTLPMVEIDGRQIQLSQVLLNLLNNAGDAVQGKSDACVRVRVAELGHLVEVSVEDNGCGVPAEIKTKLFQPFFTTKEIGKGTGLGLSISRGIIESHQGQLGFESELGFTKFYFRIPKVQTKTAQRFKASSADLPPIELS